MLTRLLAPFTPFVTERVWHRALVTLGPAGPARLGAPGADLAEPTSRRPDGGRYDPVLAEQVALVRRLVELGRSARTASKVRDPAAAGGARWSARPAGRRCRRSCEAQVADELNVLSVEALGSAGGELVDVTVKPNFRALGKRFGPGTKAVAAAVPAADPVALAAAVRDGGSATVTVDGAPVRAGPDDLVRHRDAADRLGGGHATAARPSRST